jgi:hypothetical protein
MAMTYVDALVPTVVTDKGLCTPPNRNEYASYHSVLLLISARNYVQVFLRNRHHTGRQEPITCNISLRPFESEAAVTCDANIHSDMNQPPSVQKPNPCLSCLPRDTTTESLTISHLQITFSTTDTTNKLDS